MRNKGDLFQNSLLVRVTEHHLDHVPGGGGGWGQKEGRGGQLEPGARSPADEFGSPFLCVLLMMIG